MAKRVKKEQAKKTLGELFKAEIEVGFTYASMLARQKKGSLEDGYRIFDRHLIKGNIVFACSVGIEPRTAAYKVVNHDAPALI